MEFGFNPEQAQLKEQVRRFLDGECPLDRVREIMAAEQPYDATLWKRVTELGWPALTVPEQYGGLGLAWEDLAIVAEEAGRSLFPSPLFANAVAARVIAEVGSEHQKQRWLPGLAGGELLATVAVFDEPDRLDATGITAVAEEAGETLTVSGSKPLVPYGQAADLLLVAAKEGAGISLFAIPADAAGVTVTPQRLIDRTHRAAEVSLEAVTVDPADRLGAAGQVWGDLERAMDAATVVLAAEMVGAADAAVTLASEYAKVREQFGQPIGRFQGVKHRLAEMYVGVESSRSLVYYASWAVDNQDNAAGETSMAKAYASQALDRAGEEGVQIHGAIGFTDECDAHLFYKRGRYCRNLAGSPEHHYERLLVQQGI